MCGIVGYVGQQNAVDVVMDGLRRLEYRGYDSAGVAVVVADGEVQMRRRAGKLANLEKLLAEQPLPSTTFGMGHTRWATHGAPNDRNAHPHLDEAAKVAVVHNGIIENFAFAARGARGRRHDIGFRHRHRSRVAHARQRRSTGDLAEAMRAVCQQLDGAFTLVAVHADQPDVVVGPAVTPPWLLDSATARTSLAAMSLLSSPTRAEPSSLGKTRSSSCGPTGSRSRRLTGNRRQSASTTSTGTRPRQRRAGTTTSCSKRSTSSRRQSPTLCCGRIDDQGLLQLDEMRLSDEDLRDIDKIVIIGCGTAYHSGLIAKYSIEHWTRIPVEVEVASEFRYRDPILGRQTW